MKLWTVAAVAPLALLLPEPIVTGSGSISQAAFDCPHSVICLYDLASGVGEPFTINIQWQGGYVLAPKGWDNRVSSVRNNEQYTLRLLDGEYHDCTVVATVAPGKSKTLSGNSDNKTDLVDWSGKDDSICDPL